MRFIIIYFFFAIILSCNNNTKKHVTTKTLAERANELYENDNYSEAILLYDSLISMDSTKGGYYFKRGYCKSMLQNDSGAIADYFESIKNNYSKKQTAYLNIGVLHRGRVIFHCSTNECRISEYDSALYYYNECLKIDSTDTKAIKGKEEVVENLRQLHAGHWGNPN